MLNDDCSQKIRRMSEPPTRPGFTRPSTLLGASKNSRAGKELVWRHTRPTKRKRAASDELKLICMGYKQDLVRSFTLFNNAGVAFSLLSPLAALTGTYGNWGLLYGGPMVMMWSLPFVAVCSLLVALSLAELASAYPTSGAVYYWSWAMAPPRAKVAACWVSGWLLVLGHAAFAAANARIFTDLIAVFALQATGYQLSPSLQLLVFLAVLAAAAAAASAPNGVMAFLTSFATFWNLVALGGLASVLPSVAKKRQSLGAVLTTWYDNKAYTGVPSRPYNAALGMLLSQYLFVGFDACAHVAEETHHADINAPRGMLGAVVAAATTGYLYLMSLNLCAVDPAKLVAKESGGAAVAQLFWDVHADAFGSGHGGLALLVVPLVAALLCTHQSVAANARMLYAFSRDGGVPFHRLVARVDPGTKTPVVAVWCMALSAALMGAPMFYVGRYVATVETMAVVNTYLSYAAPILFKLLSHRNVFLPGPFYCGRLSRTINVLALIWIGCITITFSLPTAFPVTASNMNYNALGTGVVVLGSIAAFYCPFIGGRHWFNGPRPNLGQFHDVPALAAQRLRQLQACQATTALPPPPPSPGPPPPSSHAHSGHLPRPHGAASGMGMAVAASPSPGHMDTRGRATTSGWGLGAAELAAMEDGSGRLRLSAIYGGEVGMGMEMVGPEVESVAQVAAELRSGCRTHRLLLGTERGNDSNPRRGRRESRGSSRYGGGGGSRCEYGGEGSEREGSVGPSEGVRPGVEPVGSGGLDLRTDAGAGAGSGGGGGSGSLGYGAAGGEGHGTGGGLVGTPQLGDWLDTRS